MEGSLTNQDYEKALLAILMWREGRGEPLECRIGMGCTVRTRVQAPGWWGSTWVGVMLKPEQYSCFNPNDPNAAKLPSESDPQFQECMAAADGIHSGITSDPTRGATHYYSGTEEPYWAENAEHLVDIGITHFYKAA